MLKKEVECAVVNHASLTVQDADTVAAALGRFRRRAPDFSDCLVLEIARRARSGPRSGAQR